MHSSGHRRLRHPRHADDVAGLQPDAAVPRPRWCSGGKSVPVALICSNSASGVRLTVNSPVASTLRSESFRPTEVNCTTGGVDAGHGVEGVRRQVEHAVGRAAADPRDRPGHDDGVQHPVEGVALHLARGRSARGRGSRGRSRRPSSPESAGRGAGTGRGGRARSGCRGGRPTTERATSTSRASIETGCASASGHGPAAGRRGHDHRARRPRPQ